MTAHLKSCLTLAIIKHELFKESGLGELDE